MRFTALVAVIVIVALGAVVLVDRADGPTTAAMGTVTLIGDSLNVGVEPYLPAALPGWTVVVHDQVGRTTPEAILELEAGRPALSSHVVVSLGTNDPPQDVVPFRHDVARLLDLAGPDRCLVWATIWRDGAPSDTFNDILRAAAAANHRIRLVDWAEMIETHPEWLAGDGLHGNETGYRERARAIAKATTGCAPAKTVPDR